MNNRDNEMKNNGHKLAAQASLQLLPLIMDNIPQAVFWKDQNLVYLGCNRAFAEDAGFASPEEVIGKTDFDMPWKDQAELYRADDRHVLDGGESKLDYEEPQTGPDGSTIWLRTSKIPVHEKDRVVAILGMYEDITEHKKAELDLLLRDRALASSVNGVIILDIPGNKPVYVNDSLLRMTGYTFEEIKQLTLADILGNLVEPEKIRSAVQAQGFFIGEEQIIRKDGSIFPATFFTSLIKDANGQPIAVQSSFFDISEQKQAEVLQQQSEHLFRSLFEMSPDAVMLLDPYDPGGEWPIVDCNTAACLINGYTREELIGQPVNIVNAPTNKPIERNNYLKQLHETGSVKYEILHRRKNGEIFPVETLTTLIKIGERELLLGLDRDITERKQAEMDLLLRDRALASSINAVFIVGLDFKPIYANEAFLKLTDYTYEEAMQIAIPDLTGYSEGVKRIDEAMQAQGFFVGEEPVKRKDGSVFPTSFSTSLITNAEGKPIAIQANFVDITGRKEAEMKQQESERLFQDLFALLPDSFMLIDPHDPNNTWPIVDCNAAACAMSGYAREELIGQSIDIVNAPSARARDRSEYLKQLRENQILKYETFHCRKDGTIFPIEVSTTLIKIGQRELVIGIDRDITERKQAEAALRDNEEKLQAIYEGTNDAIMLLDERGFFDCNSQTLKMFGFQTRQEFTAIHPSEASPELQPNGQDSLSASREHIQTAYRQGYDRFEWIHRRSNGENFPAEVLLSAFDFGGRRVLQATVRDITERKQVEAEVQREKSFSDAIINGLPGVFYLFDTQGRMVRWNKQYEDVLGYTTDEVKGTNAIDPIAEEDREHTAAAIQRAFVEGQATVEASFVTKAGKRIPYYFVGQRLQLDDTLYLAGTGIDVTERKRAEQALRDSEARYSAVVTQAKDGIFIIQDNMLQFLNQAMADMLGYTPAEMVNTPIINYVAPESRELIANRMKARLAGQDVPEIYETRLIHKNGTPIDVELSAGIIEYQGRPADAGTIRNISERKQAEADLLLRDRALASSTNAVIIVGLNFKPIYVNESFLKMTGYTREEAMQISVSDITANPEGLKSIDEAMQAQGFFIGEEVVKRKDGSTFPTNFSTSFITNAEGQTIAIQSNFMDITERKQAEAKLQQEKSFSDAIINGLPGSFYLFDLEGKMIRWNKKYEEISGYSAEEIPTMSVIDTLAEEDREAALTTIQRALMEGQGAVEAKFITKDGRSIPYYFSGQRLQIEGQIYMAGTGMDLTERKLAEAEIQREKALSDAIINGLPGAFYLFDTQGRMIRWNKQYEQVLGYTAEETAARTALDPIAEDDKERVLNAIQHVFTEGQARVEADFVTKDGRRIPYYFAGQLLNMGDQVYLAGTGIDITERRQLEEGLLLRDRALASSINAVLIAGLDFKPIYVNDSLLKMTGYTHEEAMQLAVTDLTGDPEGLQRIADATRTQGFFVGEEPIKRKDGSIFPANFSTSYITNAEGQPIAIQTSFFDITERKRLEAQVQEAFERRGLQVELSTQVSQSIAAATSLEELYERVVTQVKEQFGYYHTQLLSYDAAQDAVVLVTGYGETGEKMLAAGHRLPMGQGLIGTAAATGETVLRPALENDPEWRPNPLLPETRGEIAVPIKLGDTILGVLDVQSSAADALDADDQLLLEGLCGQIAIAIESTRLRQDMSERLEEINRLYRAVSREGWQSYMGSGNVPTGFMYDQKGLRPVEDASLAEELFTSLSLTVPGGEVIGTLAVAEDPQRILSPEDESFLVQVSEQIALALESARLFEQTQEGLAWQQAINHTSILIGQAKSVAEITRATAELLPLLNMTSCSINLIKEFDANEAPSKSDIFIVRFENQEFEIRPPVLDQSSVGWLPEDRNYYQANRVTVFPDLDDLTTMVPYDAYQAPGAVAYMRKAGMRSAITLALGVQNRPIGYLTFNSQSPLSHVPEKHLTWIGTIVDLISTSIDAQLLLTETEQGRQTLARRAAELETVATVSTTASTVLDPDQLLQAVVDLTKERFNLYHAHIYTYDQAWNTLLLAAGAGEVGRKLVAEEHAIPLSVEESLVTRAARERKPIIVNDVSKEPGFLPNPLLPETRAEMAVPMTVGDTLLGVFDVQSSSATGFSAEDANIYVTLAAQVGVALQNARSYTEQSALVTQLRELDRLKSSFLANMSHELRTPLNSILGFADVILEELDGPLTENMGTDLRLIQKNGQHLLHLINDVLDMAKIEAGRMNLNPERFTACEVLEEVTSITSTLASEKHIALFIEPTSDQQVKIFADRTRLRQVMINLVNNAIKFTETGKISLKLDALEGGRVLYTIKDTGIGIPLDKQDAIFQEFTQVDSSTTRKAGGTGLGLPISRRLVEMHGGRLWVESTGVPGEGSTFFVELPVEARITEIIGK